MAKPLSATPITKQDIMAFLQTNDDFHLELQVYNMCVKAGLKTSFAGTYEDPVTKLPRQFDIRAKARKDRLEVRLAVECKCLKLNFPLVISRIRRPTQESYHELVLPLPNVQSIRLRENDSFYRP